VTDSSWVSLRFQSRDFRLYSTYGASGFIALVLMHLVLFVVQISTSFSILVPRVCVLYHNFIAYFLLTSRRIRLVSCESHFPRGGVVEYLHRRPASHRRRQEGRLECESVKYDR
jgi:hypothetical protein